MCGAPRGATPPLPRVHTTAPPRGARRWIDALHRAGVRLDPPYYTGPPVPIFNETHDELVRGWRGAKLRKQQEELDVIVKKRREEEKAQADAKAAGKR